jgi:GMP synthase (glutamine-hydrolysing)
MRLNESAKVEKALSDAGIKLTVVNAAETFYNATTFIDGVETEKLCETVRPEVKRKIIGDTYMKVSEEVRAALTTTTSITPARTSPHLYPILPSDRP